MAKRISFEVSNEVAEMLDRVARQQETTMADIVRRALAVIKAAERQKDLGRPHIGFTTDPSKLDAEMVGVLD
jgi:hypothetical protein